MRAAMHEAASRYGTPLFVYDMDAIYHNYNALKVSFGEATQIHYACKALPNMYVLSKLREWGAGIDAVSVEEIKLALACGYKPADINLTASGCHVDEYKFAIENGVSVHVDNLGILQTLGESYEGLRVALRINPGVAGGGHTHLQVGADGSKFGLYPEEWETAHEIITKFNITVSRVHVHVGSDVHTPAEFAKTWRRVFRYAKRYAETVKVVDLGGGFGVSYVPGKAGVDVAALGKHATELKESYEAETGTNIELMIEPGKYITATAGYFICEVTQLKPLANKNLVFVNTGFNHLIRPMYYEAKHHIENISNPSGEEKRYQVSGYLCETDTFAPEAELSDVRVGDLLMFYNAGAYCMSMASNYNSRPRPAEVALEKGELKLIRPRETFEDLLRFEGNFIN